MKEKSMPEFLNENKQKIRACLEDFLDKRGSENKAINKFGSSTAADLADFSSLGKMIRGSLVFIGSGLVSADSAESDLLKTAAAMELFQSGLLIHDDIMDNDLTRRGKPSMFARYSQLYAGKNSSPESHHLGKSLAICTGDIAFFLAFELISELGCSPEQIIALHSLFSSEMSIVATAQMQDIINGENPAFPGLDELINLYRYKTGRYTFSLPLAAGAVLAGADNGTQASLEEIGELMGIIFQIRDDELDLTANSKKLGKPLGSDIAEGKKSFPLLLLHQNLDQTGKQKLLGILNSQNNSSAEIEYVISLYTKLKISEKTAAMQARWISLLREKLGLLQQENNNRYSQLQILADFIVNRDY